MGFNKVKGPPVKVGEKYKLKVEGFGQSQDPICRVENYVIFVKLKEGQKCQIGDTLTIKLIRVTAKIGFAEITDEPVNS